SSLVDVSDHLIRVVQIGSGVKAKQRSPTNQVKMREFLNQRALVLSRRHAIEVRLDRRDSLRVHSFLIDAGTVEIADSLVDRVAARPAGGRLFQNAALNVEIALAQFHEADPLR